MNDSLNVLERKLSNINFDDSSSRSLEYLYVTEKGILEIKQGSTLKILKEIFNNGELINSGIIEINRND